MAAVGCPSLYFWWWLFTFPLASYHVLRTLLVIASYMGVPRGTNSVTGGEHRGEMHGAIRRACRAVPNLSSLPPSYQFNYFSSSIYYMEILLIL